MEVGSHNICPFVFGLFYLAHVSEVYPLLAHGSEFHSSLRLLGPTERLYHMVLIRLSIDGSWGCFYLLAPVPLLDITVTHHEEVALSGGSEHRRGSLTPIPLLTTPGSS